MNITAKKSELKSLKAKVAILEKEIELNTINESDIHSFAMFYNEDGEIRMFIPVYVKFGKEKYALSGMYNDLGKCFSNEPETASYWVEYANKRIWIKSSEKFEMVSK